MKYLSIDHKQNMKEMADHEYIFEENIFATK